MGRVEPDRNQQGAHLAQEILLDPLALRRVALTMRDDFDAVLLQGRQQRIVIKRVLALHQRVQRHGQALKRTHRITSLAVIGAFGSQVGGCPDFEKFIEVGGHDAQVAQPLQHRHVGPRSPAENPLIERDQAVVPVQQLGVTCLGECYGSRPGGITVQSNGRGHGQHSPLGWRCS